MLEIRLIKHLTLFVFLLACFHNIFSENNFNTFAARFELGLNKPLLTTHKLGTTNRIQNKSCNSIEINKNNTFLSLKSINLIFNKQIFSSQKEIETNQPKTTGDYLFSQKDTPKIDTVKGIHKTPNYDMPFSLIRLGDKKSNKTGIPIIVFLHGSGERGNDNIQQLKVGLPTLMKSIIETNIGSCIIIAPQCPLTEKWVNTDWTSSSHAMDLKISLSLQSVLQILDSVIKSDNRIDTNRIYLTGLSMGGYGTWDLLQRFPQKFAAAIPICGGGDTLLASNLKNIPIWAFHGKKDKLVSVSRTIDMTKAISRYGNKIKTTIFENDGHLCWDNVYNNKTVISWLFSNKINGL